MSAEGPTVGGRAEGEASALNLDYYEAPAPGREDYWRYMAAPRLRLREILRQLAAATPRRLVDLGCGGGNLLRAIAQRFPEAALTGIDLAPRQIEENRGRWPGHEWLVLDLARPLPADAPCAGYDTVIASEVIEHVDEPERFLANALDLAEPGGRLVLSTQSGPIGETERHVGHRRHFSASEMDQLLRRAGWQPERIWNAGFPFHDLSKWWANRDPDTSMARFGTTAYGPRERAICALLRVAFRFASRRRGAQLFAVARRPVAEAASPDGETARAFADSWNRVGEGSVYTREQFVEWMEPIEAASLSGEDVLELGFGNGSLLYHAAACGPRRLVGVELGDTLEQTRRNLAHVPPGLVELHRGDLTQVELGRFDTVYCIGVLHHLSSPESGFDAVLRHTRPGGRFHCWVYAREGNGVVVHLVDPVRRLASRLPWWLTKYGLALPLVLPYYLYAKLVAALAARGGTAERLVARLPLAAYSRWIARRELAFFRHVAFDQLVTPQTAYLERERVERWLGDPRIEPGSTYLVFRNGNSWKLGGRLRMEAAAAADGAEEPSR